MLSDKQIISVVNAEFDNALGAPGGEIDKERAEAWEYYLSEQFGNEDEDEVSTVVTSDVSDVVDSIMPSLLRIFTTADNLVSFDPVGPEDVQSAQQASDYVNYIFFKRNPAFENLYTAFFDALVKKTGIWKTWWDESEEVSTEKYEGLTEDELIAVADDDELEIVEREETEENGITLHNVEFRRVEQSGQVRVEAVPPNEYRASADARMLDPSGARMTGHEREVTRSELLEMGFSKKLVASLPSDGEAIRSEEDEARKNKTDDRRNDAGSVDKSQQTVLLREAYIRIDADEDGRAELLQVFSVGDKLLSKEPADRQPFHVICPSPLPHKHIGRSVADKVMDIQLTNSTILRQTLGNLYHSNNPGHGVWEQGLGEDTMDDLLTTKVGSVTRFARPINESYAPMVVPFTAASSFPMLEYFDKAKRDRTGISSDSEGLSPEALKNIQTTVLAQSVDLSKMKVEQIARIFAETGLKTLFLHIYELVLKHQQKAEIVKLRNQWVPVDPSEWESRENMTVNIGLGIGTREQNLVHLNAIKELQGQIVEAGGMNLVVTPDNIFNMASEVVKNANLKDPEMFFTNPQGQPAPPPSDEQQQLQQAELEVKQREQQLDAERQAIKTRELELKNQEMQVKHREELLKLQQKNAELQSSNQIAREKLDLERREKAVRLSEELEAAKFTRSEQMARIRNLNSQTAQMRREGVSEDGPTEAEIESQAEKARKEVEKIDAEIERINAATDKLRSETEAQDIENDATKSGINDLLEDDDAEAEGTE